MKILMTFIILNIVNVILQTLKSIYTVKGGKWSASIINAITFGVYTVVIVYTNADFPLLQKVLITAGTNLIGVYVVKLIEEKKQKEKLWKVEFAVTKNHTQSVNDLLTLAKISHNYTVTNDDYVIFNAYCETGIQTDSVKEIVKSYKAKAFVTEQKIPLE